MVELNLLKELIFTNMAKIAELNGHVWDEIEHFAKHGQQPGLKIGFTDFDNLISFQKKRTTIIGGRPTDGKSQLALQIQVGLTAKHGVKHLIYTPETGSAAEIYAEIIHCVTGKSFHPYAVNNKIDQKTLYSVKAYIQDHFKVIDSDDLESFNLENWLEICEYAVKEYNVFSTLCDNWNDLDHEDSAMISQYLKKQIVKWNRHARKFDYHGFVVTHAKNPSLEKGQVNPKMARVDELDGGSAWYAKALNMIMVHREYIEIEDGFEQSKTLDISVKKIKKKFEGKKGTTKLDFDIYRNAYHKNGFYLPTPFNGISEIKEQSNNDIQPLETPPF